MSEPRLPEVMQLLPRPLGNNRGWHCERTLLWENHVYAPDSSLPGGWKDSLVSCVSVMTLAWVTWGCCTLTLSRTRLTTGSFVEGRHGLERFISIPWFFPLLFHPQRGLCCSRRITDSAPNSGPRLAALGCLSIPEPQLLRQR